MPNLQPENAAFLLHTLLPSLRHEHATTLKVIQSIPVDKGDYRPEPIAKSANELAWHIAAAEHRFLGGIADGQFNFDPIARPDGAFNSANIAAWYAKSFQANADRVAATPPEKLAQIIDFRGVFQLPAVTFLLFIVNHSVHHRGQLSTYLRPMGSKVPAIYGESYDTTQARQAGQSSASA
jgi:uncharacterized damage-inducible protein DinB